MKINVKMMMGIVVLCLVMSNMTFAGEDDLQALVDDLQTLSEKARKERAADRWLQNALDDLVDKYNFPWRDSLFSDDFSDGDFNQNPVWTVSSGEFWIDRRLGLRSQVSEQPSRRQQDTQRETRSQPKQDLGAALFGALLTEALGPDKRQSQQEPVRETRNQNTEPASIRSAANIPTTFAVESIFSQNNRPGETGQFEWMVMQSEQANNAYKLVITTGQKATLEVLRIRSGRTSYVQSVDVPSINDGAEHNLSWRQNANGDINVFLDTVEVIKTNDSAFRHGFKYIALINRVGDFSVSGIEVLGGR